MSVVVVVFTISLCSKTAWLSGINNSFSTELGTEWASGQMNECSRAQAWSEQFRVSKWVSDASGRASGSVFTSGFLVFLDHSAQKYWRATDDVPLAPVSEEESTPSWILGSRSGRRRLLESLNTLLTSARPSFSHVKQRYFVEGVYDRRWWSKTMTFWDTKVTQGTRPDTRHKMRLVRVWK